MQELLKLEFKGWRKVEVFWLTLATLIITGLSIYWDESLIGIISAITGVICVVLTGKGKLSCYFFGIINCVAYAYIAYQAKYYGDVMENLLYFLPMQFVGFIQWKKNMNVATGEVISKRLSWNKRIILLLISFIAVYFYGLFLKKLGGNLPYMDSLSNILSLVAMWLCVKRYMEQWIMWIIIDIVTVGMWSIAFVQNQESIATLIMWMVYLINAIIMYIRWNKSSKEEVVI